MFRCGRSILMLVPSLIVSAFYAYTSTFET